MNVSNNKIIYNSVEPATWFKTFQSVSATRYWQDVEQECTEQKAAQLCLI